MLLFKFDGVNQTQLILTGNCDLAIKSILLKVLLNLLNSMPNDRWIVRQQGGQHSELYNSLA